MRKKSIDIVALKKLMRFRPSLEDCAAFFDVSDDTIQRIVKEASGLTFTKFRDKYLGITRISVTRAALKKALEGNPTMLIFCLKNLCGWEDQPPVPHRQTEDDVLIFSTPDGDLFPDGTPVPEDYNKEF